LTTRSRMLSTNITWQWHCSEDRHRGCRMEMSITMGRPKAALALVGSSVSNSKGWPIHIFFPQGGDSGAYRLAEPRRENEPGDRPPIETGERTVASEAAISGAGCGWVARRVMAGPSATDRPPTTAFEIDGASHLADIWLVLHRQRHFKLSTDPFFVEKVRDIVRLYLNPVENAVVLCVDEKSQIRVLERT